MQSVKNGKQLFNYTPDYVVFDLETTGTSCATDEVIEISAVKVHAGTIVDEFSSLVNPGRPIPAQASAVNGITDAMVADSPSFSRVLQQFLAFAQDAVLVGHNIRSFDMKFIQRDAQKYFGRGICNDYIDTLPLARQYLPQLSHHRLTDLAKHYRISTNGAHRALNDCRMNQKIFEYLKKEIDQPSEAANTVRKCPKCGNILKKRNGRFGTFWGCTGFPECRYTENI